MNRGNCQDCERCAGCRKSTELTPVERELLDCFSVTPFLPVAVEKAGGKTVLLIPSVDPDAAGLALRMLLRKGLVQVNVDLPLPNTDYGDRKDWVHGSAALTAGGQEALDALEFGY